MEMVSGTSSMIILSFVLIPKCMTLVSRLRPESLQYKHGGKKEV